MSADTERLAAEILSSTDRPWLAWVFAAGPWVTLVFIIGGSSVPALPNVLLWGTAAVVVSIKILRALAGRARWIDAPARWSRAAFSGVFHGRGSALVATVGGFLSALLAAQLNS